jgi:membrane-associated phospholipid phosphatase
METEKPAGLVGIPRIALIMVGVVLLGAACALGAVILVSSGPFAIDTWWNGVLFELSSPLVTGVSRVFDFIGGGWFGVFALPIACVVALFALRRPWSAIFFIVAEIASAALVQLLKHLFGRARPEDIIVFADYGSFPSGHAANAATLAAVAFVLFPRVWVLIVGVAYTVLMALSRTGLHAHWLSDTLGGILIGVGVVLVLTGLAAPLLAREVGATRRETVAQ